MEIEVPVVITIHIEADTQEEADELIVKAIKEHGLPVLEFCNGKIVTFDEC